MLITIKNWNKYHHRTDVKVMHWFRVEVDIATDPKLFPLTNDAKWLFICLISLATKRQKDTIELDALYLERVIGIPDPLKCLDSLEKIGLVTRSRDTSGTDVGQPCTKYRTEQDITEHNTNSSLRSELVPTPAKSEAGTPKKSAHGGNPFLPKNVTALMHEVGEERFNEWLDLYPDRNWLEREIKAAFLWHVDKGRGRKTLRGWKQAINNWLKKGWDIRDSKIKTPFKTKKQESKENTQALVDWATTGGEDEQNPF